MGSFSNFLENEILDHVFGNAAYAAPATLYLGLSTTTIVDAGTGITEPSGNGYTRAAVTNNATNFPAASNGSKSNGTVINFPTPTGAWGTVVNFFVADASTAGNILAYGTLTVAQPIVSGNPVSFQVGALVFTLD